MMSSSVSEKDSGNKENALFRRGSESADSFHEIDGEAKLNIDDEFNINEELVNAQIKVYEDEIASMPVTATFKQQLRRMEIYPTTFQNKKHMVIMLSLIHI